MSSVITLYLNNPIQSGSSAGCLDTAAPAASTSTTGWTVAKTSAGRYSLMSYNVEKAAFGTPALGPPATASGHKAEDCWRTSAVTSGVFSAGTWYSAVSVIAVTAGGAQDGLATFWLWRSANEDGSSPTNVFGGSGSAGVDGTTVTNLSTTVAQSSSASTQVASLSLSSEYLFLQVVWNITGAGASTSADVLTRLGPITSLTAGSFLVSSAFSPTLGGGGGGGTTPVPGLMNRYYKDLVQDL